MLYVILTTEDNQENLEDLVFDILILITPHILHLLSLIDLTNYDYFYLDVKNLMECRGRFVFSEGLAAAIT